MSLSAFLARAESLLTSIGEAARGGWSPDAVCEEVVGRLARYEAQLAVGSVRRELDREEEEEEEAARQAALEKLAEEEAEGTGTGTAGLSVEHVEALKPRDDSPEGRRRRLERALRRAADYGPHLSRGDSGVVLARFDGPFEPQR